ncbi:MAG: hypothetical protein IJL97_02605 [Lachnospiraceae bacterium]|nr:hypothetical protein [Lachnospiraceae bacterium]
MRRRILIIFLCIVLTGSLAACSEKDSGAQAKETRQEFWETITETETGNGWAVETETYTETEQVIETEPATETQAHTETEAPTEPDTETESRKTYAVSPLGTAGELDGRTVIISLFVNDSYTGWDFSSEADQQRYIEALNNLAYATAYITNQAAAYGAKAEFIYDWSLDDDLDRLAEFDDDLVQYDASRYQLQADWVYAHFEPTQILEKYDADNVIYIFFFNTDQANDVSPRSIGHMNDYSNVIEIVNMYIGFKGVDAPPATYAHELLHSFGAQDLYYETAAIPQAYVDHLTDIGSNDIMYTVVMGNNITNDFTELDAYYTGLTDHCEEVEIWGLGLSEHLYQ